ncbi:uncharacterized protein EAF01_010605 [Botrytis porri]|uniref:uncharacterized protein n=1 Tax=Botrytis porri TaxID=87229 RepID=UPI0018FF8F36|nr:uncharacterized protein EAF01_010605 [Botrytis porri]KAF7890796.1 hypothetical protein EAF01_010605 [Botrytis porri]
MSDLSDKLEVLIAVDFGTTFSGLCWALKDKPNDHNLVQNWPGDGASHNKAPTTLLYRPEYLWGYQIRGNDPRYEWFKLGLHPSGEGKGLAKDYPSTNSLIARSTDDKEGVVIHYLRSLRIHSETNMANTYGPSVFSRISIEYIITVPAVWDDKAQGRTQECAKQAGMGDHVQIITEPEAAGIYALTNMPTTFLKKNETFILCDAGGGTVDLVSYTISKLQPVPRLREAARGEGGLCGSIFLNRIFAKHLSDKFANYPDWDEEYQTDALKFFEDDIKKNFDGDISQHFFIPARGLNKPELGIHRNKLRLSGEEIKNVFEPVIQDVISLVITQIRKTARPVTAVLMAGGFGSSEYLRTRIQDVVGTSIEVRRVANGDTAIVKGALISGLSKKDPGHPYAIGSFGIDSRVARRHYGTMAYDTFIPGVHDENLKEPSPYSSGYVVPCMQWFIQKNTNVEDTKPVVTQQPFFWEKPVLDGSPTFIETRILVSEKDQAPVHLDRKHVSELVKIHADISGIPADSFPRKTGVGHQAFYRIPYKIETAIHSGSITFALLYGDQRYEATKEFL